MRLLASILLAGCAAGEQFAADAKSSDSICDDSFNYYYESADGNFGTDGLQYAVDETAEGGTVHVCEGEHEAGAVINKELTLKGQGSSNSTLLGWWNAEVDEHRVLTINSPVRLEGLTIQDGKAEKGGGVYAEAFLTMEDVVVTDNWTDGVGGGVIAMDGCSLTSSTIMNNHADAWGGGLVIFGDCDGTGSVVTGNTASGTGGGVTVSAGSTLTGLVVSHNQGGSGGGVVTNMYTEGPSAVVRDVQIYSNLTESSLGGGILAMGSTIIENTQITDHAEGGGIRVNPNAQVKVSVVIENSRIASNGGGAMVLGDSETVIRNTEISDNVVAPVDWSWNRSAIVVTHSNVTFEGGTISGHVDGGLALGGSSQMHSKDTVWSDNAHDVQIYKDGISSMHAALEEAFTCSGEARECNPIDP